MSSNNSLHPASSPNGYHDLLSEQELIHYLRIPEVSNSQSHHNVIKNLIRMRDLPRIQICNKLLFPKKAILEWIENETFPKKALTDKAHADISTNLKSRKLKIHR